MYKLKYFGLSQVQSFTFGCFCKTQSWFRSSRNGLVKQPSLQIREVKLVKPRPQTRPQKSLVDDVFSSFCWLSAILTLQEAVKFWDDSIFQKMATSFLCWNLIYKKTVIKYCLRTSTHIIKHIGVHLVEDSDKSILHLLECIK